MKDNQLEGVDWNLDSLSSATGLIDWTADQFGPVMGLDVVEVGAGIGTYTEVLLDRGANSVTAVEPDRICFESLRHRFASDPRVVLKQLAITTDTLEDLPSGADLVVCQNVLEHIEYDQQAFDDLVSLLKPDGKLFLLVPAHPWLFGSLDRQFEHFRRYRKRDLLELSRRDDLKDVSVASFNALGIPGWWLKGKTGREEIGDWALRTYEYILKGWRPIEDRCSFPVGLSLILKARRS